MEKIDDKAEELIESCREYFYKLVPGVKRLIEELKNGQKAYTKELFYACEGIAWLSSALYKTKELHNVDIDITNVNKVQKEISIGLENDDFYYIAETLENESLPMLLKWFEELGSSSI